MGRENDRLTYFDRRKFNSVAHSRYSRADVVPHRPLPPPFEIVRLVEQLLPKLGRDVRIVAVPIGIFDHGHARWPIG